MGSARQSEEKCGLDIEENKGLALFTTPAQVAYGDTHRLGAVEQQ
jgi:hypothetical protein